MTCIIARTSISVLERATTVAGRKQRDDLFDRSDDGHEHIAAFFARSDRRTPEEAIPWASLSRSGWTINGNAPPQRSERIVQSCGDGVEMILEQSEQGLADVSTGDEKRTSARSHSNYSRGCVQLIWTP